MDDIASMAHDVLLSEFGAWCEEGRGSEPVGTHPRFDAIRAEILRRMDSTARRVDVLPDGHRQ